MRGLKYDDKFLLLLWDKMQYFHSHYIYPSQTTWLKWLTNQGGLEVSRRTLNRYFRQLQNRGIVGRIRRLKKRPDGGYQFNTTLYSIGILGLIHLRQIGRIAANEFAAFLNSSKPFRDRIPKRPKKGLTPNEKGFYPEVEQIGEIIKDLI